MPKKSCLIGPFDKQHDKSAKPLLKSASQCLCHIHLSLTTLIDFVFPILRALETWSDECLKSPV